MNTPMQELINSIENVDDCVCRWIVDKAKELLEKEKQCIIDAYHEGKRNHGIHTVNESEQYYTDLTNQ